MAGKKPYRYFMCRYCERDFLASPIEEGDAEKKKTFCPKCGENSYTEKIMDLWLERPFRFKRLWTEDENDIIIESIRRGLPYTAMMDDLPGRTIRAIQRQGQRLKVKHKIEVKRGLHNGAATRPQHYAK